MMRRFAGMATVLTCGAAAGLCHAAEPTPLAAGPAAAVVAAPSGQGGLAALQSRATPLTDAQLMEWRSSEAPVGSHARLRISLGDSASTIGGGRPLQAPGASEAQAYELSLVRDWPQAVAFETGRFGLEVTPHAGVGVTSAGGLAEAGATVRFGQRLDDVVKARLGAMGVRDGKALGGRGRWYLFAAASGRAVGFNLMRNDAGWAHAGLTTDATSTLVGDAQVGVGWRKGDMQTSLGFVHREIKGLHTLYGVDAKADSLVAFTFAVRPGR
jgi:hypothetical protein